LLIIVNCWPSPTGNGTCDVTIEYELQNTRLSLSDVSIVIPFAGQVTQPGTAGTGTCTVDRASRKLIWNIPLVDQEINPSGLLEFSIDSDDTSVLYPIQIQFQSEKFVNMEVFEVKILILDWCRTTCPR
jgi:hypothetical protein